MNGAVLTRERLQDFTKNGPKVVPTFSAAEMQRRLDAIRGAHGEGRRRRRALHLLPQHQLLLRLPLLLLRPPLRPRRHPRRRRPSISAGIDGGQPARRTFGGNVTYTDWQKDNYFHAVRQLTGGVKRLGIEFDHVNHRHR